jgi:putative redox protein
VDARVTWDRDLQFIGVADSGYPVRMDSKSSSETGAGPVELTLMALAGCTAMDVISILQKKRQQVESFHVQAHADRAHTYPKVITSAVLEYVVVGRGIDEEALLRAIELSVKQYCPVHAMLGKAFPIELRYSIYETREAGEHQLMRQGIYSPALPETSHH